jgi:hypothetical protein
MSNKNPESFDDGVIYPPNMLTDEQIAEFRKVWKEQINKAVYGHFIYEREIKEIKEEPKPKSPWRHIVL